MKRKRESFKHFIYYFIFGIFIGLSFIFHRKYFIDFGITEYLLILCGVIIGYVPSILIHEAGHLFFGLRSGYNFVSFRILRHLWYKEDGKIVYKKNKVISGILGQCLMIPKEEYNDGFKYLAYNRGGYIFNLLLAIILYLLMFIIKIDILFYVLSGFYFIDLIMFISNFIPNAQIIPNDGHNIKICKKHEQSRRALYYQLYFNNKFQEGYSVTDFSELYNFDIESSKNEPLTIPLILFDFNNQIVLDNIEKAYEIISKLFSNKEYYPKAFRNGITILHIFTCYIKGFDDLAKDSINSLPKIFKKLLKTNQKQTILAFLNYVNSAIYDENFDLMKQNFTNCISTEIIKTDIVIYETYLKYVENQYNNKKNFEVSPSLLNNVGY